MKKILLSLLLPVAISVSAQQRLFNTYSDSAKLVSAANEITGSFFMKLKHADPSYIQTPRAVLNTETRLIFYLAENNSINLPLWSQLSPTLKIFFYTLANSDEKEGKKIFGAFFNGFFIARELGHAVQYAKEKGTTNKYKADYFANTLAILFWRESAYSKQLEICYSYVNSILKTLPDPVPAGENAEDYFQKNYEQLLQDPQKFLYFQFSQFKTIYEDKSLKGFDSYLNNYLIR